MSDPTGWRPLSQREGTSPIEDTPVDGVPDYLWHPLERWVSQHGFRYFEVIALRLRIVYEPLDRLGRPINGGAVTALRKGIQQTADPESALLDVVDAVLHLLDEVAALHASPVDRRAARDSRLYAAAALNELLTQGGSKWITNDAGDKLVSRVDPAVKDAIESVLSSAPTGASRHLRAAWVAAYGRSPNPSEAYGEAIKAVEASAGAVVSPKNKKATLGTIIADLGASPDNFGFVIRPGDIDPVIAAARSLWQGQTDRHGEPRGAIPIELEAARAAFMLAVTLVHWFSTGCVAKVERPKPG